MLKHISAVSKVVRLPTKHLSNTVEELAVTDSERDRMTAAYSHLHFPERVDDDHQRFISAATSWFCANAPRHVMDAIVRWRSSPEAAGVLVIDNIGCDSSLPDTPIDGRRSPDKLTSYSEVVLTGVGNLLGEPFAFRGEREGLLVQDLAPVRGKEAALTNEGTDFLGWHTEHAATGSTFPEPVNVISYLVFLGLRSDHEGRAKTLVADVRDALTLLSPETIQVLQSPSFLVRPPLLVRQTLPAELQTIGPVALLTGPENAPEIRAALYGDLCEPIGKAATQAFKSLSAALDAVRRGFTTKPGRLMIVNNRVALHARSPFTPRYDGQDRWVQRLLVTDSLWPLRTWQNNSDRILEP